MKITNYGRGIHEREIPGIERLRSLPENWYAHTNLDLVLSRGAREIDVILYAPDRIILIDLKDWRGKIESKDGGWYLNEKYQSRSPIAKINENARDVSIILSKHLDELARRSGNERIITPRIDGIVVLTATKHLDGIAPTEVNRTFTIDDFIGFIVDTKERIRRLQPVNPFFRDNPINSAFWKPKLDKFFNVSSGYFRPGKRRYGNYTATSDASQFSGPNGVFLEYEVEDDSAAKSTGILRRWDLTKADTRFQTEQGRHEILGRERDVISWLNDRNPEFESSILQLKVYEPERGIDYWEVFDKRRRLKRLSLLVNSDFENISSDEKEELVRQLLSRIKLLHNYDATHLDLGPHSVWIEKPSTIRFSHLMSASFPELKSLGESRYQFLSSVKAPEDIFQEDITSKRKDVFLLGCLSHYLLFGCYPTSKNGNPPEWDASIDSSFQFAHLHNWLEKSLSIDSSERFSDAQNMLEQFNLLTLKRVLTNNIVTSLERFKSVSSYIQLIKRFPIKSELRDDEFRAIWLTETESETLLVKVWKRACWSDGNNDFPKILDFLNQSDDLSKSPIEGTAEIRDVIWMGDAIVLSQKYVEGRQLLDHPLYINAAEIENNRIIDFLKKLINSVINLHNQGVAHGDLKPSNIIVKDDDLSPILIDLLDFSCQADGDIKTTEYSPNEGGRFERDRFAITKIVDEILFNNKIEGLADPLIKNAISDSRTRDPKNSTLLPLLSALESLSCPRELNERKLSLSIVRAQSGLLLSDEGVYGVGFVENKLFLRGAAEVIEIVMENGAPKYGRRLEMDQKRISWYSRKESLRIHAEVLIANNDRFNVDEVMALIQEPEIAERLKPQGNYSPTSQNISKANPEEEVDLFDDDIDEYILERKTQNLKDSIDIPNLWRRLIEVEGTLSIEGVATEDSGYRPDLKRHIVPFDLERGTFDFDRNDKVLVEQERNGRWVRIGFLDIGLSSSDLIFIDTTGWSSASQRLIQENQRIRFQSHLETTSRTRREAAITRVLNRQSVIRNFIDYFSNRDTQKPWYEDYLISPVELSEKYGLNASQVEAFQHVVRSRPLGLLQGPPGTGKTKFIAALIHFSLTHGLAKNVLLASQSHEAVNNAAEAVLRLFSSEPYAPSILRVGQEGNVSERLLPFHVARVEALYKDRFSATLKERLQVASEAIGIPLALSEKLIAIEVIIRPVVERLASLYEENTLEVTPRIFGLQETLRNLCNSFQIDVDIPNNLSSEFLDALVKNASLEFSVSEDSILRFKRVARLSRDICGTVSTRERSFESFLAGTRQIVAGTCVGLGRSSLGLMTTSFDLVVVDEAARCQASELAVPIQAGRWVVMVGDHAQLEPQFKEGVVNAIAKELSVPLDLVTKSDFQRLFESPIGNRLGRRLTTQYRMLPSIGRVVSNTFYGDLTHGRFQSNLPLELFPTEISRDITWITTDSFGEKAFQSEDKTQKKSLKNVVEADIIVSLLRNWNSHELFQEWLRAQVNPEPSIGIISMYSGQASLLREKIRLAGLTDKLRSSVKIGTVDSYQGKENKIVILSLVRNNLDGLSVGSRSYIKQGFLYQPNRINVAISRAMDKLIIVGACKHWPDGSPLARLKNNIEKESISLNAQFVDALDLLNNFERGIKGSLD